MKRRKKIRTGCLKSAIIFLFLAGSLVSAGRSTPANCAFTFSVPAGTQPISIGTENTTISSSWVSPSFVDDQLISGNWSHISRKLTDKTLAGIRGKVIIDVFRNHDLQLTREFWYALDKTEVALRNKITNYGSDALYLESLEPLSLSGENGLAFKENNRADSWHVLIQKRLKNGKPFSLKPSDNNPVEIDPFCVFTANRKDTPDLLIGFLSQKGHLAHLLLQFDQHDEKVSFSSLRSICQFDGCLIPPGGERTSQWITLYAGFDANELIAGYADRVGEYHGVKRPEQKPPSVFCTWYFHGRHYNEKLFMDDINSLRENRLPFDVFLIDDCWANGNWGYWTPGEAFPSGMKNVTQTIKSLGYRPGIWTAPYSVDMDSELAREHPEWLLRTQKDSLVVFGYSVKAWILDPTYPGVLDHLEEVYRRLAHDYGFSYFKFDFMRAVYIYDNVKFFDPHVTRLEAYTMGLEAIRKGVGPDAYISVCGGHYGGSLGIANSQRSGSDVVSIWIPSQIECFRQNILRTWMSRLWHVDPDALMIRKRETSYYDPDDAHSKLSLGTLSDDEALTFALNQYVSGGLNCFSEYLRELQPERRRLYRHVIPSLGKSSIPLDIYNTSCPSQMMTEVDPHCPGLGHWKTIAVTNWDDKDKGMEVRLSSRVVKGLGSKKYVVSEFFSQRVLGIFSKDDSIKLDPVLAHHSFLLRIAAWDGLGPVLAGTDLHFSGGGVEIKRWQVENNVIRGQIQTDWDYPVRILVAFPENNQAGYLLKTVTIQPGQKAFYIEK